jgi:hypothetical protein
MRLAELEQTEPLKVATAYIQRPRPWNLTEVVLRPGTKKLAGLAAKNGTPVKARISFLKVRQALFLTTALPKK